MNCMATCIACMGNELAKDDGVGMRLGRTLERLTLPLGTYVRFYPQIDMDLLDDILAVDTLVICDATRFGVEPGTVTVSRWDELAQLSKQPYCCHGIGLQDLVRIATELAQSTANWEIHLVGIEAETVDEFGLELSPSVKKALPPAIKKVLELVGASDELVIKATALVEVEPPPDRLRAFGG